MAPIPPPQPAATGVSRRGARLWVLRLTFLAAVVALSLGLLDALLVVAPGVFGDQRANEIFSRYDTRPGGIYVWEKRSRMRFMWPDFATENYWSGYRWQHSTDALGFRNPPGIPRDVLLLGDSLIHGHGVEEWETVAHFLRAEHQVGAYSMARQGAALYDEYVFLRTYLPELAPTSVLLFVFLNDFDDLEVYRTTAEIAEMPELDRFDYAAIREWTKALPERLPSRPRRWFWRRPSVRLLLSVATELRGLAFSFTSPAWAAEPAADPPFLAPLLDPDRRARQERYYRTILGDLAKRCRSRAITLRVVYLSTQADPGSYGEAEETAVRLLRDAAGSDLLVYDTRTLFSGCESCFLPRDGHYSATGHRRLARFLAENVLPGALAP